mmetsp:Transcript_2087/g.4122  ORF Transcript_2087/g.4122 Transcript_2087/m.4122 type:complete len:484 (-) Transcript_2087:2-1453(-)
MRRASSLGRRPASAGGVRRGSAQYPALLRGSQLALRSSLFRGRGSPGSAPAAAAALTPDEYAALCRAELAEEVLELRQELGIEHPCLELNERSPDAYAVDAVHSPAAEALLNEEHQADADHAASPVPPAVSSGCNGEVGFAFVSLAEVGLGRHRDSAANEHAASSPAAPDGRAAPPRSTNDSRPNTRCSSSGPAQRWRRRPRNRVPDSAEVRARDRLLLEKAALSCGLSLEPDPRAPGRETLRAVMPPPVHRTCQEQRRATQRLVQGIAVTDMGRAGQYQRGSGFRAATWLAEQKRRLESGQFTRSRSEGSLSKPGVNWRREPQEDCSARGSNKEACPSWNLPAAGLAKLLKAGLADKVPVHLTHASSERLDSKSCAPLSQSVRDDVLVAALSGTVPVRMITTPSTGDLAGKIMTLSSNSIASEVSDSDASDATGSANGMNEECDQLTQGSETESEEHGAWMPSTLGFRRAGESWHHQPSYNF